MMYVEKDSILPEEESQAENNQTKENRTSMKDLPTYLTTEEKVQWEEVAPRNQGKRKEPPENTEPGIGEGNRLIAFWMKSSEGAGEGETEIGGAGERGWTPAPATA